MANDDSTNWTFLGNHTHVLVCIDRDPDVRVREIATHVGLTERAVQRILSELVDCGAVTRERRGRCNHYTVNREVALRHPLEAHCTTGALLELLDPN